MLNLIVCGFKAAGKTTLGKRFAKSLNWSYIDTDQVLEEQCQCTCRELYTQQGEAAFRQLEKEAILSIAPQDRCVISVGGGALENPETVRFLKARGVFLFLNPSKKLILDRLHNNNSCPPFLQDPEDFERVFKKRKAHFAKLADLCLEVF